MYEMIGVWCVVLLTLSIFSLIIILPFIFWGMGDVFRTGNQNVLLTINSEKVSTSEFANYLNRLINLSAKEKVIFLIKKFLAGQMLNF